MKLNSILILTNDANRAIKGKLYQIFPLFLTRVKTFLKGTKLWIFGTLQGRVKTFNERVFEVLTLKGLKVVTEVGLAIGLFRGNFSRKMPTFWIRCCF